MPQDIALASPQGLLRENDYRSFCAALSESARGRDFLAEFARRNRNADTEMLLAAIDRLEAMMRAEGTALERLREELRMLLIAIRLARPDIDAASPITKTAKLATLLDMLEGRIDTLVAGKPAEIALPDDAPVPAPTTLTVVSSSDEPELPIPSPAAAQSPPPIALVRASQPIQEEAFVASKPLGPTATEPAAPVKAPLPAADPLAGIMKLSEAERIALFT